LLVEALAEAAEADAEDVGGASHLGGGLLGGVALESEFQEPALGRVEGVPEALEALVALGGLGRVDGGAGGRQRAGTGRSRCRAVSRILGSYRRSNSASADSSPPRTRASSSAIPSTGSAIGLFAFALAPGTDPRVPSRGIGAHYTAATGRVCILSGGASLC
jgi:hypothetical protein